MKQRELRDLTVSTVVLGFAFAVMLFGGGNPRFLLSPEFIPAFIAATALVGVSFLPHEMGHRVSARAINAYAEYRMWTPGVVIATLSSFLGVVFAAPGGIEMSVQKGERYGRWEPHLTVKQIGMIAVLGPVMNVLLGVLFAFLAQFFTITLQGQNLLVLGTQVNAFLALFNLIPFYPMDGYKVMRWSTLLWVLALLLAGLLFFL